MDTSNFMRTTFIVVISYFLIKAFMDEKVNDLNASLISLAIGLTINYALSHQKKENFHEGFQDIANGSCRDYYTTSVYDPNYKPLPRQPNHDPRQYRDPDIEDMKDVALLDRAKLEQLENNEDKARAEIRKGYKDEMKYTTSHEFNTRPLGAQIYSYTFLPPENWFRAYDRPPVCVTDKYNSVNPSTDSSSTVANLMEFDTLANVTRPLEIDTNYIDKEWNKKK
jgi:hypothetical protein